MTFYDAWITAPEAVPGLDSCRAAVGSGVGHCMIPEGRTVFFALRNAIQSGRLQGRQTGPLTWAALMTPAQIMEFLQEIFGRPGEYERHEENLPPLAAQMTRLRAFVAELPEQPFALVADEF